MGLLDQPIKKLDFKESIMWQALTKYIIGYG